LSTPRCVLSKKGDLPESYCNVDFHETAKNQLVLRRSPGACRARESRERERG
jgi:hypothetical protein